MVTTAGMWWGIACCVMLVPDAAIQAQTGVEQTPAPLALAANAATGPIRLDGRLTDTAWYHADSITTLRQREPVVGAPSTEQTVVKVLRTRDALYVGIRAYDTRPSEIRATQLRRDADLSTDDYVTVLIDSFHDRRSAFVFRTNPNGAMWDAQFSGVDILDADWNGIWDVAVARDSAGWTAEFRIPFQTLRFNASADASFGFNVERFIRRKNEETLWAGWGRADGLYQLAREGTLVGLGTLTRAHSVELVPYALARADVPSFDSSGIRTGRGGFGGRVGLDTKTALTPTLTADLTINTDFAQVEADSQVINLTRFPLFFPEKREFFLESSGIFDFGTEERAQLFYSRRIGLDTSGTVVPILAGARVTGRTGPWTLGLLEARTGASENANDVVLRVRHDLLARSYVGAMFVDRDGPGVAHGERAAGFDVDLPLVVRGHNVEPKFWIAATQTATASGAPLAWRLSTDYPNDLFDNFISLYRIDGGFDPTLGFVRRTGIWETTGHVDYTPRPGVLGIRQLDIQAPIPSWDVIADESGSPGAALGNAKRWQTASFDWQLLGGTLQSGDRFGVHVERYLDAPTEAFDIFRGVDILAGRYWWTRGAVEYESSAGRPVSGSTAVSWGRFYDGRSTDESMSLDWRGGGHVILGVDGERNATRLPVGAFVATSAAARVEYAFSTRMSVLALAQTNNEERRADVNLRFHWIPTIGDDLYVVWNSGYPTRASASGGAPIIRAFQRPLDGQLVVKATHRFVR